MAYFRPWDNEQVPTEQNEDQPLQVAEPDNPEPSTSGASSSNQHPREPTTPRSLPTTPSTSRPRLRTTPTRTTPLRTALIRRQNPFSRFAYPLTRGAQ